jgi:hypothetical protein
MKKRLDKLLFWCYIMSMNKTKRGRRIETVIIILVLLLSGARVAQTKSTQVPVFSTYKIITRS